MSIAVRFTEFERYDITIDSDVIVFMATTNGGTYHAEVRKGSSREVRETREKFKEAAIGAITEGVAPCEIIFEDEARTFH